MHLGNIFTALLSWLSVRKRGGRWILRIEDLDPQRSKYQWVEMIEADLQWLGLDWDEGGLADTGPSAPYSQSRRNSHYIAALESLKATGLVYPCYCTRADLLATNAPHQSDGRVVYGGKCRPSALPCAWAEPQRQAACRLHVTPDFTADFVDQVYGVQRIDVAESCGDFIVRRADGAWAYQLAVVVDDIAMGVNEIMRGCDLLSSVGQQSYLRSLLGAGEPAHAHLPLICNADGRRLSKRDSSLAMDALRERYSPSELLGVLGHLAGLCKNNAPTSLAQLVEAYDVNKIPRTEKILINDLYGV